MACSSNTRRLVFSLSYSRYLLKSGVRWSSFSNFAPMSGIVDSSSNNNSTHLERTENSTRQETVTEATVTVISQLSETVKALCLRVENDGFTFLPGQWVDFFIPGLSTVGGFSICSSPKQLKEKSTIELAVKHSDHPPALWVHTRCCVGSKVQMRVGGNFYFDPKLDEPNPDLLLIAGGVGINPLYSIARHVADICNDLHSGYTGKTTLLFSAQNTDELLFKESLLEISTRCPTMRCRFFTTKQEAYKDVESENCIQSQYGRINESSLQEAVSSLDRSRLTCYICGPPPMIKNMTDILRKLNIAGHRIQFEKWW